LKREIGGGGSRTRVRKHLKKSYYMFVIRFSGLLILVRLP
jgi:hypothetical protein